MNTIKKLINERYDLFNVNVERKNPRNKNGVGIEKWETKTYEELLETHDYSYMGYGLRTGRQTNGKYIVSLDFDCCGDKDKITGERLGCNITKGLLKKYFDLNVEKHGFFNSSTKGNYNLLIDISQCNVLLTHIKNINKNKLKLYNLEILINNGSQQILPPTKTKCKITNQYNNERKFYDEENPMFILTEDSSLYNYVNDLFEEYLSKNTIVKKNINNKYMDDKIETETISTINDFEDNKNIIQKIKNLIDKFPKNYFDTYEHWLNLCFIIYNETEGSLEGYNLFLETCKSLNGFDENECFKQYNIHNKKGKNLKFGTLMKMYKECENISCNNEILTANTDNEASKIIFETLKDRIFYYEGHYFYKIDKIWTNDKNVIDALLLKYIQNKNIKHVHTTEKGIKIYTNYSANVTDAMKIKKSLYSDIIDHSTKNNNEKNVTYDKFHSTTKDKIAFIDGVLDMKNKKFYKWENINFEYYSTVMIKRYYEDYFNNPDETFIKKIREDLIENMYGDKSQIILQFLSRAISGHIEDKKWHFYMGNRNCGKGVLFDALTTSFEDYVKSFGLANILSHRTTAGSETVDDAKSNGWLLDFEFCRIGISQEVPELNSGLKMNARKFKTMASGGDKIDGRKLQQNAKKFNIDTTWMIFGNNSLIIDANDTWEECLQCSSVNQFKTKQEIEKYKNEGMDEIELKRYKVKDTTIKDKVKSVDWANAFVYLLMQNYSDEAVYIEKDNDNDDEEGVSVIKLIKEKFVITNDETDMIKVNDLYDELIIKDKKKINTELLSHNVFKKKCKNRKMIDFVDKWVFTGIKMREGEE